MLGEPAGGRFCRGKEEQMFYKNSIKNDEDCQLKKSILAKLTFMLENDRITSMKVKEKDKRNVSEQIIQHVIFAK